MKKTTKIIILLTSILCCFPVKIQTKIHLRRKTFLIPMAFFLFRGWIQCNLVRFMLKQVQVFLCVVVINFMCGFNWIIAIGETIPNIFFHFNGDGRDSYLICMATVQNQASLLENHTRLFKHPMTRQTPTKHVQSVKTNANRINMLTQQNPTPVISLLEFVVNTSLHSYIYTSIQSDLRMRKKIIQCLTNHKIGNNRRFFVTIKYFNYLKRIFLWHYICLYCHFW